MSKYYIDTCIWLNLFKKEGDPTKGKPYWKIAEDVIKSLIATKHNILYSEIVLRELQIKTSWREYEGCSRIIENTPYSQKAELLPEDKIKARQLESAYSFNAGFYDLLHMILAARIGAILVTRDRKLIGICKENGIEAARPEELSF